MSFFLYPLVGEVPDEVTTVPSMFFFKQGYEAPPVDMLNGFIVSDTGAGVQVANRLKSATIKGIFM